MWRLALVVVLVVTACTSGDSSPTTITTTPVTTSTTVPVSGLIDPASVFEQAAPSLAYIETGVGTGSGILVENGLVLTAAHVVWPQRDVRVVFPNGAERRRARVIAADPIADIAVVDVSAMAGLPEPARIGDPSSLEPGSPVFLIGYPGETDAFPQPTISQGIVSRLREWEPVDWSFLQTDATTIGGQSGGAVVSASGEVVGLTNFLLGGEFGLSAAIDDVQARVARLLEGEDVGGLGDRLPPEGAEVAEATTMLDHFYDSVAYVVDAPVFTDVVVSVRSETEVALAAIAADSFVEASSADGETFQEISFQVTLDAPLFIEVRSFAVSPQEITVRSSVAMTPWVDEDDGQRLVPGETLAGSIDYPGETDWFSIDLIKGQAVTIEVDSVAFDPSLTIDTSTNFGEAKAFDADRGGGLFGWNPRLTFTADATGEFLVIVEDLDLTGPGAYFVTVED
ncbi:MAG: trypsin-like peptidase domain-containing protein [Acidimicrobiia bacterium]|nr:trypsin-like peptidase domain-containing protein [Acidimicrobiia bacterium]